MEEDLGTLDDYTGPQKLTPEIAKEKTMGFACVGIHKKLFEDQKGPTLQLELQNDEKDYFLNLNKTNLDVLGDYMQETNMVKLIEFVGKVFYFDKIKVRNPATSKYQDSLLIDKIE